MFLIKCQKKSTISIHGKQFDTNFEIQFLVSFSKKHEESIQLSEDAGGYLCNYLYFKSLEKISSSSKVIFIHIADFISNKAAINRDKQTEIVNELIKEITSNH